MLKKVRVLPLLMKRIERNKGSNVSGAPLPVPAVPVEGAVEVQAVAGPVGVQAVAGPVGVQGVAGQKITESN